jgi:hypothetical protein
MPAPEVPAFHSRTASADGWPALLLCGRRRAWLRHKLPVTLVALGAAAALAAGTLRFIKPPAARWR